jgi:hypothetical protein
LCLSQADEVGFPFRGLGFEVSAVAPTGERHQAEMLPLPREDRQRALPD